MSISLRDCTDALEILNATPHHVAVAADRECVNGCGRKLEIGYLTWRIGSGLACESCHRRLRRRARELCADRHDGQRSAEAEGR